MSSKSKIILTFFIVILISAFLFLILGGWVGKREAPNLDEFAKCLNAKGVTMYGAYWCPHCQNEKNAFGESFKFVNYVECTEKPNECLTKDVQGYPTWTFPDGRKLTGEQGIRKLSQESGCPF